VGENYYLYVVGIANGIHKPGDCGVGKTFLGPGIRDCLYGTLYVFPGEFIRQKRPTAYTIKMQALKYYFAR
jgi:hypothetical protein